ncbi:MAG: hypothetical protein AAF394_03400 [Planctomycetota bacterium]
MKTRLMASAVWLILLSASCIAQVGNAPASQAQGGRGPEISQVKGTLEGIARDRIKIKSDDGKETIAVLGRSSRIQYEATASANFLRPGMMVRFESGFDVQQGTPLAPIAQLEVFRPSKSTTLQPEERKKQTAGIYPASDFKDEKEENKGPRNTRQAATRVAKAAERNFVVVGQLRVVQAQKMRIQAGNRAMIVELKPDAKISVSAGDAMFFKPGDKVKLTGARAAGSTMLQVELLEVEAANPLGEDAKPGAAGNNRAGTKRGSTTRRNDKN